MIYKSQVTVAINLICCQCDNAQYLFNSGDIYAASVIVDNADLADYIRSAAGQACEFACNFVYEALNQHTLATFAMCDLFDDAWHIICVQMRTVVH